LDALGRWVEGRYRKKIVTGGGIIVQYKVSWTHGDIRTTGDDFMATERIPTSHEAELPSERAALPPPEPAIVRGADNQAAAYEALLGQWLDVDPEEDERAWQRVKHNLQETRKELGERLLFAE